MDSPSNCQGTIAGLVGVIRSSDPSIPAIHWLTSPSSISVDESHSCGARGAPVAMLADQVTPRRLGSQDIPIDEQDSDLIRK